ncbi:DNA repair protein RadA [Candidatus Gottesmanbacteria bacterium RIFCSPHIGHO2_01_FULL_47_48]|uniref:DNA repair protein RadA n=1 Tax=Candidatus Gottesmanbacteria bacterium RIFCSPHIGHO2_01_FULL_47_48 TaxID=1798381 RepID=A0A1F6A425_9BACT|nr:MAG: DNA repair protein RadA [Candidatus Gottesmanbacteria bacterium RIFCSPHIGHO2_01_FULL_47_48]
MAKRETNYVCQQCGYQSPSFLGKCPNCGAWNSLVEEVTLRPGSGQASYNVGGKKGKQLTTPLRSSRFVLRTPDELSFAGRAPQVVNLKDIEAAAIQRISTGISELDRVLGGGIVPGMAVLLAGEPGIGKSTLLLELARNFGVPPVSETKSHLTNLSNLTNLVLYVAGEESASQIRLRAERLNVVTEKAIVLEATDVDVVVGVIEQMSNGQSSMSKKLAMRNEKNNENEEQTGLGLVIVDSIQTLTTDDLEGPAGSVGQVRECAARLIRTTKQLGLPLFLVGHVTKEGAIAGPKVLEHIVDTILSVEGDRFEGLRIIRTSKNRFGPTDEVGVFQMTDAGLVTADMADLTNLSNLSSLPGSCLTVMMEGTRPMIVEIQALVTSTPLPSPRRVATGVDYNRLLTVIAILQKRLNLPLYKEDVYVSVSCGLKISEPAADVAMALSILSSFRNRALPARSVAIGELDLLGNVRRVSNLERRIKEAKAMKLTNILEPSTLPRLADFKL